MGADLIDSRAQGRRKRGADGQGRGLGRDNVQIRRWHGAEAEMGRSETQVDATRSWAGHGSGGAGRFPIKYTWCAEGFMAGHERGPTNGPTGRLTDNPDPPSTRSPHIIFKYTQFINSERGQGGDIKQFFTKSGEEAGKAVTLNNFFLQRVARGGV